MRIFRQILMLVFLFAILAVSLGLKAIITSANHRRESCYWVLFCTLQPPIVCWEECRPMPYIPKVE